MFTRPTIQPTLFAAQRIAAAPQLNLVLPAAHSLREASIVAAASGALAVTAQCSLVFLLNRLVFNGKSKTARARWQTGYVAHHIVCVLFMVAASVIGIVGWLSPAGATAAVRLGVTYTSAPVRFLSAALLGMLLLWDLPCSVLISKLRNPVMFGHHVAMSLTTLIATLQLPMHYGFFFLGISELSTVPLCVNELASHAYDTIEEEAQKEPSRPTSGTHPALPAIATIRDSSQVLFAVLFLFVRGWMFTRVTLGPYLADMLAVLSPATSTTATAAHASTAAAVSSKLVALRMMLGLGLSFNALQAFWVLVIVRTALGMMKPPD